MHRLQFDEKCIGVLKAAESSAWYVKSKTDSRFILMEFYSGASIENPLRNMKKMHLKKKKIVAKKRKKEYNVI